MKPSEIFFSIVRIPLDFLMALTAFVMAYHLRLQPNIASFIREADLAVYLSFNEFFSLAMSGAVLLLLMFFFFDMYEMRVTEGFGKELQKVLLATFIWVMAVITYYFIIREFPFSRLVLGYTAAFIVIFVALGRMLMRAFQLMLLVRGVGRRNVVFIGHNSVARELQEQMLRGGNYNIVGVIGGITDLPELIKTKRVDQIIQTTEHASYAQSEQIIELCRELHVEYLFVPDLLDVYRSNIAVQTVAGIPLIALKETPLDGWGKVGKRLFDITFSALVLTILSPVFAAIAIAIKFDSHGTVFFRYLDDGTKARRVGQKGDLFHCLKFRTMHKGTHAQRYSSELQARNTRKGTPMTKIKDDPRVTRVGTLLRKYSLDELPQFWNVLKGDMSVVGPRPHLPEEVKRYEKHHKFVLAIKPGITGLAQISGRSDLDFEEEVRLDTYYIEKWSLWLDLKIIFKTPMVVVRGHKE